MQRVPIVIFTAAVFGAGYGAHVWIAGDATVPPPPAAIGSEFAHGPGTPAAPSAAASSPKNSKAAPNSAGSQPLNRPKLMSEIQQYSSNIKSYQARLDELDSDFDHVLLPLLAEEQRGRYASLQKRWADRRAKGEAAIAAETAPLSDEQIFRLQQRPLYGVLGSVSVSMRFDQLKKELKLTSEQEPKVRDLLVTRRGKFLDLIDSTPPPTITLSQLARHVEKIGADPSKVGPPQ
jgi:hypothetical protein